MLTNRTIGVSSVADAPASSSDRILVERLEVEIVEIVVAKIAERAVVLPGQELLDDRRELVFLDEDRFGVDARCGT